MSLRINYNGAAQSAYRTLGQTDNSLGKSIERLSSGYKVNSAGDDPAGLVISEKLRAQVSGLGQAIKNVGDATNMVKTAEGALGEVHRLLRNMRDLAVHAANTGATDSASAQADQSMITNSINSLNKIASETQFGNRKLLDGSAGIKTFINGSSVMSGDFSFAGGIQNGADVKIAVTTAAEKAKLSSGSTYQSETFAVTTSAATYAGTTATFAADGTLTLKGGTTITYNSVSTTVAVFMASVNAVKDTTGVQATFNTTTKKIELTSTTSGTAGNFFATVASTGTAQFTQGAVNGTNWSTFATADGSINVNGVKIDYASGDNISQFINTVNSKSALTGVQASWNETDDKVDFLSTEYGSAASVNVTNGTAFLGTAQSSDTGVDAKATVTQTVSGVTTNISDNLWSAGKGLILQDSQGNKIVMTEAGGSATSAASSQFVVEKNTLTFQVGAYSGQTRDVNIAAAFSHNMGNGAVAGKNVSNIDVTTAQGAQDAIKVLDQAISDISNIRASLGATQTNVLESSANSLSIAKENISASESTIRDTDMASEMVQFTKLQMLNQAGVAMLAQANQAPQQLLRLLS